MFCIIVLESTYHRSVESFGLPVRSRILDCRREVFDTIKSRQSCKGFDPKLGSDVQKEKRGNAEWYDSLIEEWICNMRQYRSR